MELTFLKVDKIEETKDIKLIHIPTGGIQFSSQGKTIISMDPVQIEMTYLGIFQNILGDIRFAVYTDESLNSANKTETWSLFSVVAHEVVQSAILKEITSLCKVIPFKRRISESERFGMEYESSFKNYWRETNELKKIV